VPGENAGENVHLSFIHIFLYRLIYLYACEYFLERRKQKKMERKMGKDKKAGKKRKLTMRFHFLVSSDSGGKSRI